MKGVVRTFAVWLNTDYAGQACQHSATDVKLDWLRVLPFFAMHVACLAIPLVGWSPTAIVLCIGLFFTRMFAITAFYHRYFSHKTFKTSRIAQFLFAVAGLSAVQRGPLWWAAHHRQHHMNSDRPEDVHSPIQRGLFWSHMGWFLTRSNFPTNKRMIQDWLRYPELVFLNRHDQIIPVLFFAGLYAVGEHLGDHFPYLATSGLQFLMWGLLSTVLLWHGTFTINSLAHRFGNRPYDTNDDSRNNVWLALLTLGEGWHNNHHRYPLSCRQGFHWWQLDITYILLYTLSKLGIIWDLRPVPPEVLSSGHR